MSKRRSLVEGMVVSLALLVFGCSDTAAPDAGKPASPSVDGAAAGAMSGDSADAAGHADAAAADNGASPGEPLKKAELLVELPADSCNTPDAMALLPDGNIILSVPNFNDLTQPPLLMKITPENKAEPFIELPNHPETEKPVGPLGICVAPDGNLFFADYQMTGERQSRVMRVTMKDGMPAEIMPVITGFRVSNAVIVH
ncbi:MAG: hypothetical protein KJZ87_03540, partial [Thermoguttaceae bacterium]|nr:hypothetical protein [Thermoguttaceae bacterium]